ncbi:hypothetical protein FNF31_05860 [Cafeteria roenbergensis]|uniref:Cilia- and flagella-associated protein 69 ARM repeats domain-containing protein n=1 Tax=Cafeteria roenbergensis TaxID=33653 RepID=A0A5A8CUX5_CAFRO|nr:hypothetical protein FNF31_05860 [Cafeteria roenbergensis]KAA0170929.1 hypothetical protein FNF28_01206 [Cafeteria roenbergensis]
MARRQRACLRQLASLNKDGFWLADLPLVERLLRLAMARVARGGASMAPALVNVIRLLSVQPRAAKAHEEAAFADAVRGTLRVLGSALRAGEPRVELAAAETLLDFAHAVPPEGEVRLPGDSRPTRWNANHDLLRRSGTLELVAAAFASEVAELQEADVDGDGCVDMAEYYRFRMLNDGTTANDDDQSVSALRMRAPGTGRSAASSGASSGTEDSSKAKQSRERAEAAAAEDKEDDEAEEAESWTSSEQFLDVAARLVREVSEHPSGAAALTAAGVPLACLEVLRLVASHKEPIVGTCLETLWNLCEHSSIALTKGVALSLPQLIRKHRAANAAHVLATGEALGVLRSLFSRAAEEGSSVAEKALRNDTIVVATVLARTPSPPKESESKDSDGDGDGDGDGELAARDPTAAAEQEAARAGTTPAVAALLRSGMLDEGLLYACAAELDVPTPAPRRLYSSHTEADLELKLLLWELASSAVRAEADHRMSLRAFARLRRVKNKRQFGAPRFWSRSELMRIQEARDEAQARDDAAAANAAAAARRAGPGAAAAAAAAERRARDAEQELEALRLAEEEEAQAAEGQERAMLVDWAPAGPALRAVQSSALVPALLTYLNPVDDAGSGDPVVRALAGLDASADAASSPGSGFRAGTLAGAAGVTGPAAATGAGAGAGAGADPSAPPPLPPHPYVSRWSPDQKRRLELSALSVLRLIGPLCLPAVVDADGCFVLSLYLRAHSAALRARHGADVAAARAASEAARAASLTGRRGASATGGIGASTAGRGAETPAGASSLFAADDASRQYCTLRLLAALCRAPRGGAAVAAELGSIGVVGDVVEILRAAEAAASAAASLASGSAAFAAAGSVGAAAAMGLALSQPPGALASVAAQAGMGASAKPGGIRLGDGAAGPESGGKVPLGLLAEAACEALTALCGGCGVPRRAVTTAELDEDEQMGAAETDGVREAIDEATAQEAARRASAAGGTRGGEDDAAAGGTGGVLVPTSARALSARNQSLVDRQEGEHDTRAPRQGGAAGAGRAVFRPNQKAFRASGGFRLVLRWLAALATAQRAELRARDAEAEAAAPRLSAAAGRRSHLNARGEASALLPARSALARGGDDDVLAGLGATGQGAPAQGGLSREPTATATLMMRATTASGFAVSENGGGGARGGASVAAGSMQKSSSPLQGPPDSEAQLGASLVVSLWSSVSGSRRAVARLVEAGAIDSVLDWLEVCSVRERGAVLGLLADVAAEPASKAQFRAWRSETDGGGAASLLMRTWCEDEARRGVKHGPGGEVANLLEPLAGAAGGVGGQPEPEDEEAEADDGGVTGAFGRLREALRAARMWDSVDGQQAGADKDGEAVVATGVVSTRGGGLPSLAELAGQADLRPKVWAVLSALGWEAIDEGIAGDLADLPLAFRVALQMARALPEARRGAAWVVLDSEMQSPSLPAALRATPVPEDAELLRDGTEASRATGVDIRAAQRRVAQATQDAVDSQAHGFMQAVVDKRLAIEESARLAHRRRAAPKSLSFEERRAARDRKKAMLARQAGGPGAGAGAGDGREGSPRAADPSPVAEPDAQLGEGAGAYHPIADWQVGAAEDTDSDLED